MKRPIMVSLHMEFPGASTVDPFVESIDYPLFARIQRDPPTPTIDSVTDATQQALPPILENLPAASTVAVGVGSRGIASIEEITRTVVKALRTHGHTPIIIPAMGSHGGGTAEGQKALLAEFGITEDAIGCAIDARMDTTTIVDDPLTITVADSLLDADAVLPINRIKPHTGFSGRVESGLCKMLVVGFGKHAGAQQFHRQATVHGFDTVLSEGIEAISEHISVPGGIGIVENVHETTALIEPVLADAFIETEADLLEQARQLRPTLPATTIDLLVVDRIGKDIAGTGMDTTLIGRTDRVYDQPQQAPSIERIVVRGVTEASHGNVNGIGLADVIHQDVLEACDLAATYANVLTSGGLRNAALPLALPSDESVLSAAVRSLGSIPPDDLRIVWIQDTSQLSTFRLSETLVAACTTAPDEVIGWNRLRFDTGAAVFEPVRED